MIPAHITHHAIERYQERIANVPEAEVVTALSSPVIMRAVELNECRVILPTGHRCVISHGRVVTVTPPPVRRCRAFKPRMKEL